MIHSHLKALLQELDYFLNISLVRTKVENNLHNLWAVILSIC